MKGFAIRLLLPFLSFLFMGIGSLILPSQAKAECQSVSGNIFSQVVSVLPSSGATCTSLSPIGLCTSGTFTGDVEGTFEFIAQTLDIAANPNFSTTGVAFYTGDLFLQTDDGNLTIEDAGAFNITPGGDGEFGSVQTIIMGTGELVGAAGRIRDEGIFIGGCVDSPPCELVCHLRALLRACLLTTH